MRLSRLLVLIFIAAASAVACSGNPTTSSTIASISISGAPPAVGAHAQFSATITLPNGTQENVTDQATWSSSNTSIATVSTTGVVTGVTAGSATLTATYQGATVSQTITL